MLGSARVMSIADLVASLPSSLLSRYEQWQRAKLDARALLQLLLLEARRNIAILDVAVGAVEPLDNDALWEVPTILSTEVLEALLSRDTRSEKALDSLRRLPPTTPDGDDPDAMTLTLRIHTRATALQALSRLNQKSPLSKVRIKTRIENLRRDWVALSIRLAQERATK